MKRPAGKISVWMYVVGFFLVASLVYGLVIEPLTQSGEKAAERILQQLPTDAPTAAPTAQPTAVRTDTPAPVTQAPTETPAPTKAPTATPAPTFTPAPTEPPTLRQGDKGQAVRQLQSELIRLGYLSGSADGDFGRKTTQAVKDFQVCNGLKEDGVFGENCWRKLTSGYFVQEQMTVYVSKKGVYHTRPDCSNMKTSTKMSLSDAIRKDYKEHSGGCH